MNVGKKIKNLRKDCGLSQKVLAKKMKVTQRTISHWENNTRKVSCEMISKISKFFNKDFAFFFTKKGD